MPHARIFVTQVDVGSLGFDRPGGDQHALEKAMRVALEIVTVLEGAGLALIRVDREIARFRLLPDELPLAPGREAGAAQAPQTGGVERGEQVEAHLIRLETRRLLPEEAPQQPIAAISDVVLEIDDVRDVGMDVAGPHRLGHLLHGRVVDVVVPDLRDRRGVAVAHAGRPHDANLRRIQTVLQRREQLPAAHHLAGQAVAHPDGQRRRRRLVLLDHVEMRVERRGLVHRRLRQPHLLGRAQRGARPRDGRSGPGSGADARSADRAGAAGHRAVPAPRSAPAPRPGVPSADAPPAARRHPDGGACGSRLRLRPSLDLELSSSAWRRPGHRRANPGLAPTTIGQGAHSGKRQPVRARLAHAHGVLRIALRQAASHSQQSAYAQKIPT